MAEARRVLDALALPGVEVWEGDIGGAGYKKHGHPLPPATLEMAKACDAILFGSVGDPDCDRLERHLRPEQAILGLRLALTLRILVDGLLGKAAIGRQFSADDG